jgi:hypothetical protein
MTITEFRRLYNATPFKSFTIHLADGRRIMVRHREFLAISPTERTAIVYQPDGAFDIIDLLLVTSLTVNGKKASARKRSSNNR